MTEQLTEIIFESPCPVNSCINKTRVCKWTHTGCGGQEKLNAKGILKCIRCGTKGRFVDWRFNCGDHDFDKASAQGVAHALGIMSQLSIDENQQKFIVLAMKAVMQQFLDVMQ